MRLRRWPPPPAEVSSCGRRRVRRRRSLRLLPWSRSQGWSRIYLQRAAFDGSAPLEQLGEVDTDGPETGLAQLLGETCRGGRQDDIEAVGHGVEAEHIRVGA